MSAGDFYPTTGWRTIMSAKQNDFAALERLMVRYRPIIIKEMASRAEPGADAEDLTHEFISAWLRRNFLKSVEPRKGRFRNFIKQCVKRFLIDVHRHKATQPDLDSVDATDDEGRRMIELISETLSPMETMDLEWARQVLALALEQLQQDYTNGRRGAIFTQLEPFLQAAPDGDSYAAVAADLGMSEEAVRVAVHRMRKRFGELTRNEIKESVGPDEDWEKELRYFLELLGRNPPVT
ncbi:MAG: hypothetical protein QOF48_3671 [Verrucomicrobiota bacterium]|jgi:RNA polymerase sigma-70 factor (ECF subfamily)